MHQEKNNENKIDNKNCDNKNRENVNDDNTLIRRTDSEDINAEFSYGKNNKFGSIQGRNQCNGQENCHYNGKKSNKENIRGSNRGSNTSCNSDNIMEITSLSSEGQGVGRLENMAVFVEGAIPGDKICVDIIKNAKSYAIGKIRKILSPSDDRIQPQCLFANRCGGCSLQQMNYAAQCRNKQSIVLETMNRIGGFDKSKLQSIIMPIMCMDIPYNYRNNIQMSISGTSDCPAIGFLENNSHVVVDSNKCLVMHLVGNAIREVIRNFIIKTKLSIYQENINSGLLKNIVIRIGFNTKQVMIILVMSKKDLSFKNEFVKLLKETVQNNNMELVSVLININDKKTNIVLGKETIPIYGREFIEEVLCGITYRISPYAFFQVNTIQAEVLFEKVVEFADLNSQDIAFDLYCGTGSISLALASHCGKVIGVEIVEEAIIDARANSKFNNIENCEFFVGKSEDIFPQFLEKGVQADVIIVDPPRKGMEPSLLESIIKMSPPKIVYVSCNPATLARDCKCFCETGGYNLLAIQPVDMFPWTGHVETVVLMSRIEK